MSIVLLLHFQLFRHTHTDGISYLMPARFLSDALSTSLCRGFTRMGVNTYELTRFLFENYADPLPKFNVMLKKYRKFDQRS